MSTTLGTKIEIAAWNEQPYRQLDDGGKFTRTDVILSGGTGPITDATFEALMYYRPDGTSTYVTLMHVTATLDGRSGSCVLAGQGSYDGTTARMRSELIEGSATGDLAGVAVTIESTSTQADYPLMPLSVVYSFR